MPSISVVIPCFNAIGTIADAIKSVLAEEAVKTEIVVVDDGSTDDSLAIARSFEPMVRVFTGPNQGVSAARNRGIAETTGEWIVFLDSDDLFLPGTLKSRLDIAEATNADVVVCDWQDLIDHGGRMEDGRVKSVDVTALTADAEIACATHFWATTAALMYRRSLVERMGGFRDDLPVIQDARFLFDAAYHGARFVHSTHVGARYRVRPQSLSRRDPRRFWRDVILNARQIEALWGKRGALTPKQRQALADVYNGAVHGLFRAVDPSFREGLSALRSSSLPIDLRNRLAEFMSSVAGLPAAARIAARWTTLRRSVIAFRRHVLPMRFAHHN